MSMSACIHGSMPVDFPCAKDEIQTHSTIVKVAHLLCTQLVKDRTDSKQLFSSSGFGPKYENYGTLKVYEVAGFPILLKNTCNTTI